MESVLPGAEAFEQAGGPTGVLLCHGFTGSPQTLRPWAEYLAAEGMSVSLPRLPGHGTTWQQMASTGWTDWYGEVDRAFAGLAGRCETIFVAGLSMGACLALRLAEVHGARVRGLVLVNPSLAPDTKLFLLAPVLKHLIRSLPGIASDIAKPGAAELGYTRVPVRAAATLPGLWRITGTHLRDVTQPVLVYRSATDHVVGPASMKVLLSALPPNHVTVRELPDSYHVATLDYDAETIFAGSLKFIHEHGAPARLADHIRTTCRSGSVRVRDSTKTSVSRERFRPFSGRFLYVVRELFAIGAGMRRTPHLRRAPTPGRPDAPTPGRPDARTPGTGGTPRVAGLHVCPTAWGCAGRRGPGWAESTLGRSSGGLSLWEG